MKHSLATMVLGAAILVSRWTRTAAFTMAPRAPFRLPRISKRPGSLLSAVSDNNYRRSFSSWVVPSYVKIKEEQLEFKFVRSSGAGGQNVNKVNSCVQIRFHVDSASWMPYEVQQRFHTQQARFINKEGYYTIQCQEQRTQTQNRKIALQKLQAATLQAWPRPKVRQRAPIGLSVNTKERRRQQKQHQKFKKESRRRVDLD